MNNRLLRLGVALTAVLILAGCDSHGRLLPSTLLGRSPVAPSPSLSGPSIGSISPMKAEAGSSDLRIRVTGKDFLGEPHDRSEAVWSANGSDTSLATTFVSSTQLTAVVPAALLKQPVLAQLFLKTGDPTGDIPLAKSNPISFVVTLARPVINAITPTSVAAGSRDLTITVRGSHFVHDDATATGSGVFWQDGNEQVTYLDTTYISSTELTAVIPATLLVSSKNAKVVVMTFRGPDDTPLAVSNSVTFTVN